MVMSCQSKRALVFWISCPYSISSTKGALPCYVVRSNHQEHTYVMFIKVDQVTNKKDVSFVVTEANTPIYIWYCTPRTIPSQMIMNC